MQCNLSTAMTHIVIPSDVLCRRDCASSGCEIRAIPPCKCRAKASQWLSGLPDDATVTSRLGPCTHLECILSNAHLMARQAEVMRKLAFGTPRRYNHILKERLPDFEVNNSYIGLWIEGWTPVKEGTLQDHCLQTLAKLQDDYDQGKTTTCGPLQMEIPGLYFDWISYTCGKIKAKRDGKIFNPSKSGRLPIKCLRVGSIFVNVWRYSALRFMELTRCLTRQPLTQLSLLFKDAARNPHLSLYEQDWCVLRTSIPHVQSLLENSEKNVIKVQVGCRLCTFHTDESNNVYMTIDNLHLTSCYHTCASAKTSIMFRQYDWQSIVSNQTVFDSFFL
jgi:hypothetical protein